jgi:hypothetical protein
MQRIKEISDELAHIEEQRQKEISNINAQPWVNTLKMIEQEYSIVEMNFKNMLNVNINIHKNYYRDKISDIELRRNLEGENENETTISGLV